MRVLVTGGAGFIGSHLVERLLGRGDGVIVLDDLSTGSAGSLGAVCREPFFELVRGSVCDGPLVGSLVRRADAVIHLAATVGVRPAMEQTVATLENNLSGARNVLIAAARERRRTLVASSSEVYGRSTKVPFREDATLELGPPTSPRWSYACAKAIDEHLALALHREQALPVTVLRFFNVVGPRQSGEYGMVLPRFVARALQGAPLEVHGDGTQTRSFTHVDDVVEAVVRLLDEPRAIGRVVNVGAAREVSIEELARLVVRLTSSPSVIEHVRYETLYGGSFEDTARRVPDVTSLEELTAFRAKRDLEEVILDVVAHLRGASGA